MEIRTVKVPAETRQRVKILAAELGMTMAEVFAWAVDEFWERQENGEDKESGRTTVREIDS